MSVQLVIAGFHRSGTSLLAQLLHRGGLFLGHDLIGAMPSNPYGHLEDLDFVGIHRDIMEDEGLTWHVTEPYVPYISPAHWEAMRDLVEERNLSHRLWGFKDPRVCFFLGAWKYIMPGAKVVIVYRDYAESTYSIERRQSQEYFEGSGPVSLHRRFWEDPDRGLKMWNVHNRALIGFADAYPDDSLVLSFRDLQRGMPVVAAMNDRWDVGLTEVPTLSVFDPSVTRGRPFPQAVLESQNEVAVKRTWEMLQDRSHDFEMAA